MDGKISKALFLLFCSNLVWPINTHAVDDGGILTVLKILSLFLMAVALAHLSVVCCRKEDDDTNDENPMMNDDAMHMNVD